MTDAENFLKELTEALNRNGMDAACKTPDHILANYLLVCLANFRETTYARDVWIDDMLKSLPE